MQVVFFVGYLALGILQLFATMDGLEVWFGLPGFINFFLAAFLAYIPLVGTIAGFVGATQAWGWSWLEAGALFFGPMIAIMVFGAIAGAFSRD